MASTTGNVRCLQVSDDFGFTTIEDSVTGDTEVFILWFSPGTGAGIPANLTAFTRIMHSMWISQLRTAHADNLSITIVHPTNSAIASSVRLGEL